jgi:hypothetical protein
VGVIAGYLRVVKGNVFTHNSMKEDVNQPHTPRGTPDETGYVNFEIAGNTHGVDFGLNYGKG